MYEKKFWLFTGVLLPIVLIIIYFIFLHPTIPLPEIEKPTLDTIEIKAYEAFMERCKLLISLATALIGAIGLLFIWEKKKEIKTTNFQKAFIFTSAISAGFSIYLGYITYCRIIEFLSNKMFNINVLNPYLRIPIEAQFWTFLISIILLGFFVFIDISNPKDKS
ncbi:MAG: hypothetical protein JSW07_07120 [bacterium]|nr:MAG: hypothetical protein JSW07_07120 [bacterium]